jgi:hypothetical protein
MNNNQNIIKIYEHNLTLPIKTFNKSQLFIWDFLLSRQKLSLEGHFLDIGVFFGTSACTMALHQKKSEFLHLLDIGIDDRFDKAVETIREYSVYPDNILCHKIHSTDFHQRLTPEMKKTFRWISIDGGHTGQDILNDLEIAEQLLSRSGIICMDDFFNERYPQITKAYFDYNFSNPGKLVMFLVGLNKAYLCRPSSFAYYADIVHEGLQQYLLSNQIGSQLFRTSYSSEMICYGIRDEDELKSSMYGPDFKFGELKKLSID